MAHTAVQGTWSSADRARQIEENGVRQNEAAGISTTEKMRIVMETT